MNANFSFMKRVLAASAMAGAVMALGSQAFAGPGTWVGTAITNNNKWGSATTFASNFSPFQANTPGFGSNTNVLVTFGSASGNTASIPLAGSPNVSGLTFNNNPGPVTLGQQFAIRMGSTGITMSGTGTQAVTIGSLSQLADSAISANGNQNLTISALSANGKGMTVSGTGTGKVVISQYTNASDPKVGNFAVASGDVTISAIPTSTDPFTGDTIFQGPTQFDVSGGILRLTGDNATTSNVSLVGSGSLNATGGTTIVRNASLGGSGTFTIGGGSDKFIADGNVTLGANLTTIASVTSQGVATQLQAAGDGASLAGNLAQDGHFKIDFSNNTGLYNNFTAWNLLSAAGTLSGNFSDVALSAISPSSPYAAIGTAAWTDNGNGSWQSATVTTANGDQWLVYSSTTGNLVVVPEPSTMVFAGVGVAMAGWSVWKKRRLAMLAKKN